MSRLPLRRIATALLASLLALPLSLSAAAQRGGSNDAPDKKTSRAWARRNEVDKLTGKRLEKAREHLANEEYEQANAVLDRLRVRSLNAKEREQLYTLRGYVAYGQGELQAALENFEKVIQQGTLTREQRATFRFQIGQICMQQSNWAQAAGNFERWFAIAPKPNSVAYYMLALAYWQQDDVTSALEPAQRAVALSDEPQEGWLQLLLAIRLTRKEYREAIPLFDSLIRRFPKKAYWIQLSTLHGALGNYPESLLPLQLAHTQGLLTEDAEIRRLAELLLFLELPIRAAGVMTGGVEDEIIDLDSEFFELLSNSWIMAREYDEAVEPLRRAAQLAQGGRIYVRLAEVHIQRERWEEATAALAEALEKGDLPNPGQAELLMGIAFYSRQLPEQALQWFARAQKFPETQSEATTWLKHIERERSAASNT